MFYVIRHADGTLLSVARQPLPGSEPLEENSPEVLQFLKGQARADFEEVDADFVRVLEDLIDTLIVNNVIRHTDLPAEAQRKLLLRKGLRDRMQGALNLLDSDESIL